MITSPIISAGSHDLSQLAPGPDMRQAIIGWCRPMTLEITTIRSGSDGDAAPFSRSVMADGLIVPAKPQELDIKDDGAGTRAWRFWTLFTLQETGARIADILKIAGRKYKVLSAWDYGQFGFFKLMLGEDFA